MSNLKDTDSFFGSAVGTWMGGKLNGAGAPRPRGTYLDFGYPRAKSVLDQGVAPVDDATYGNAAVVDILPPPTAAANAVIAVQLTFTNTGTSTWTTGNFGIVATLGSDTWGPAVIPTVTGPIAPGGHFTFNFNITVPNFANTYTFQYQMINLVTNTPFGQTSPANVTVTVSGAYAEDAQFISILQSANPLNPNPGGALPVSMRMGETIEIDVIMKNTGTNPWSDKQHELKEIESVGWSITPVAYTPSGFVAPGANATFTFNIVGPQVSATLPIQFRMFDTAAGLFGEATTLTNILVILPACQTPILDMYYDPPLANGTYSFGYGIAYYTDNTLQTFVGSTNKQILNNLKAPTAGAVIHVDAKTPSGAFWCVPYRVYTTYPTGTLSTIGTAAGGIAGKATAPGATEIFDDNGLTGFDGSTYPTCVTPLGPPITPPPPMPNILDGVICDGSGGGQLIGGELVFDFTNPVFPFNRDDLPTADWPRVLVGRTAGQPVTVRMVGINGAGQRMSARGTIPPGFTGVGNCAWKVERIVVENPSTARLWVGWGDELELETPYKVNDDPNDPGQGGGYLIAVYKNGMEQTRPWMLDSPNPAITFDTVLTVPTSEEPAGKFVPSKPFTGVDRYEIIYIADNLTQKYSNRWKELLDSGAIVIYER